VGSFKKAIALYKIIFRLDPSDSEPINKSKDLIMEIETAKVARKPVTVPECPAADNIREFKAQILKDFFFRHS